MANPAPSRQHVLQFVSPNIADTLFYETVTGRRRTVPEYGTPHPNAERYPDHKLCHAEPSDEQGETWHFWYINERTAQDAYNWEFSKADIGGTNFDAVVRTYVSLREDFTPDTPAMGATMPSTPTGVFSGTFVLAERKETRSDDPKIDSLFVIDRHTYVKKVAFIQNDYDEAFGKNLQATQTLYYSTEIVTGSTTAAALFADGTNAYWGLQSSGIAREGKQLTAQWYVITARQVVPSSMLSPGRTYLTTVDYSWPGVVSDVLTNTWERREGGQDQYAIPIFSKEAYRGPCKGSVTETWSSTAPTPGTPNVMLPLPLDLACPFFGHHIEPTLHVGMVRTISTGTAHPIYKYTVGTFTFPATKPVQWPTSIVKSDEVQPFRGGYLRTIVTAWPPDYTFTTGDGGEAGMTASIATVTGTLRSDGATLGTPPVMSMRGVTYGGKPYYADGDSGSLTSNIVHDGFVWRMTLTIATHVGVWIGTGGSTGLPDDATIVWTPVSPATGAPTITLT